MMNIELFKRRLPDHDEPAPPYFLKGEDFFVRDEGKEIFVKKIYSISPEIKKRGSVIMAPGIATNANLFRIDDNGSILSLNHNRSFANLLAAEGFDVYLYHPGYVERTYNRYVCKHCKDSIYYGKRYSVPSSLSLVELVEYEVPMVIEFVREHSQNNNISWIGYSLGGMILYSYLSKVRDTFIKNVITIGSPMSLSQMFIRIIPYTNMAAKALGLEETALLGALSENLVPLTRLIRILPGWMIRYNIISLFLFNPLNIHKNTVKTLLGKIIEPIPTALEKCIANIITCGFSPNESYANYIMDLRYLRKTNKNFLFFFGPNDMIAPPDSVYLAHEVVSPDIKDNLIIVPSAGHVDLIVGKTSMKNLWIPSVDWLKQKSES